MRIILISLKSQTSRRTFQEQQMMELGLAYERFEAITPKTLSTEYQAIDRKKWERTVTENEMACLASHREVWRSVASGSEPALILEDDAILAKYTANFLSDLEQKTGIDHATLEVRKRKKIISRNASFHCQNANLHRLYLDRSGAAAYVLWPNGARKLLLASEGRAVLADAVICSTYALRSFQTVPGIAMQSDQCALYGFTSPLTTQSMLARPKGPDAVKTPAQVWRRVISQIKQGLRLWTIFLGGRRKHIPVDSDAF
ncbi:glycosyl transferase family 25 [Sedimentitalea sp. CY04]|uniref:Glycosyl transferase family 25 n=1 Tax=Parasedimentitalea denitrificans TaxID=2211118 RepID=A0ABX0WAJ1_9RHOB|nr:glycosyltransferase family 25 protein [Sedimentitalea sp. CY04]NIZ61903.1 glycosyl transferase family 25 [Sedimentitalea sp. CY04]